MLSKSNHYATFIISISFLIMLMVYDITQLYIYAKDFPYYDQWDLLPTGSIKNIFSFHNENLQVFYNLISELMYKIFDWNLRYFSFVSFFFYLLVVLIYFIILKSSSKIAYFPLFLLAILSPNLSYNWLWSLLMQTHTYIMFFLIAVYFGFISTHKYSLYMFVLSIICSILSMNIPLAVSLTVLYSIKEILSQTAQTKFQNRYNALFSLQSLCIVLLILSFRKLHADFSINLLDRMLNAQYLNLISFYISNSFRGFSFVVDNKYYNISFLLILVIMLSVSIKEQYNHKSQRPLIAIILCILFNMLIVVAYRMKEVYFYEGSFIRHNEVILMLQPALFALLLNSKKPILKIYGYILLIFSLSGTAYKITEDKFSYWSNYLYKEQTTCIEYYFSAPFINIATDQWKCSRTHPHPIISKAITAKHINLSFTEKYQKYSYPYKQ